MPVANSFNLAALRPAIRPFRLHWFPRLRSTNDHAIQLRKLGKLYAPAIVLAGHQLAGRGRGSNTWWSGEGSLTITVALPMSDHVPPHQLPLIAGLAVHGALTELTGSRDIQLKWPNDLLLHDRKLAGLLCERVHKVDLIGIGINVNVRPSAIPKSLRDRVATLREITPHPLDMNRVVATLTKHLRARLSRPGEHHFPAVLNEYDSHHALVGRQVMVHSTPDDPPVAGVCVGLDTMGRLLLRDRRNSTVHRVIAGHVVLR